LLLSTLAKRLPLLITFLLGILTTHYITEKITWQLI